MGANASTGKATLPTEGEALAHQEKAVRLDSAKGVDKTKVGSSERKLLTCGQSRRVVVMNVSDSSQRMARV